MKKCPKCSVDLKRKEYEGFAVLQCESCRGHLVTHPRLDAILRVDRLPADELKAEARSSFREDTAERLRCPACLRFMEKKPLRLPGCELQMDACPHCAQIWMDGGELALAQLGHQTSPRFLDAQGMKRRVAELELSPERKAAFEQDLAALPEEPSVVDETIAQVIGEVITTLLRTWRPPISK